jgi:hypothetical protein
MKLSELLVATNDTAIQAPAGGDGFRVFLANRFTGDPRYWRLEDYAVSSALSGPSVVLIPREQPTA